MITKGNNVFIPIPQANGMVHYKDFLDPNTSQPEFLLAKLLLHHLWPEFRTSGEKRTIDQSAGGKLRDKNTKESWALIEDLALHDNKSYNDLRDFAQLVKAISLPHDVPNASYRRLIELKNQVQRLMDAHLAPKPFVQVNKIASSCEICSGPHDTQYCMKNPDQAFVDYASSRTNEARVIEE
nr:MAK10-like protein [Tanacetum cinerariifolium]